MQERPFTKIGFRHFLDPQLSKKVRIEKWNSDENSIKQMRLQEAGVGLFQELPSRKSWKKAILENRVLVDGKLGKTSTLIKIGNHIELLHKESPKISTKKADKKIKIIHEDSDLIIVVKPAGIITSGNHNLTLNSILRYQLNYNALHSAHRLDKDTHGLVVLYKNIEAANWINLSFENRKITKTYFALVEGVILGDNFEIKTSIDGKKSHSIISKIGSIKWPVHTNATFVQINPLSGRKHQIRKHLKSIGHPIVGDLIYNNGVRFKGQGLFLSCSKLSFFNEHSGKLIEAETDLPKKFKRVLCKLDLP